MEQVPCEMDRTGHQSRENDLDNIHREMDQRICQQNKSNINHRDRNDCQRRTIADRLKDLNQSSGQDGSFHMAPRASSHDSIHTLHRRENIPINHRQMPDIIKDIPRPIKCITPETDESSELQESPRVSNDTSNVNQKRQPNSSSSKGQTGDNSQNVRRARPLTATKLTNQIAGTGQFRRNTTRSHSFRARPISAGNRGPLKTTADNLFARPSPVSSSTKIGFGLTQSTKLLQQYQATSKTPTAPRSNQTLSNTSSATPTRAKPSQEDSYPIENGSSRASRPRPNRQTEKGYDRRSRNIPIRSQSFRTSDDERKNTSFEKAVVNNYRSQSYQTLSDGPAGTFESDTLANESPLWKSPSPDRPKESIHHSSHQLTTHESGDCSPDFVKPKLRQHRSPQNTPGRRGPRPTGFAVGGSDPSFPVDTSDDSMDPEFRKFHDRFRYHSAQTSNHRINYSAEDAPPPPYHEVIQQRAIDGGDNKAISTHKIKSRRHISPDMTDGTPTRLNLRSRRQRITQSDISFYSSEGSSPRQNYHNKENLNIEKEIPYIDDTPNGSQNHRAHRVHSDQTTVRMRQAKIARSKMTMREHRNSYITAVNASKTEYRESKYTGSLESIGGSSEAATIEPSSPGQPLDRGLTGSVDSVLTTSKPLEHTIESTPEVKPRRAQSEDRYITPSYVRASYVDATSSANKQRGRSTVKKSNEKDTEGLKRRPSLNKQMRKKFESIIGGGNKNKTCDDTELLARIRSLPPALKGTEFNIKRRGWHAAYCLMYEGYLYIWKDPEQYRKARHMVSQTNIKFSSSIDLSALITDIKLADCLCDVAYSTKRNNVFKITIDERNEMFIEANSKSEMNEWTEKIRAATRNQLNTELILNLKKDSKYSKKPNSKFNSGARSPVHRRRRKTFGVLLEDCPMDDHQDLPLVVTTCCSIIESQLETDCHGIYRTAANERIKNEVEEEMNKSMENIDQCEHLRDVKIAASVLKSFFRQLPDPLFTDRLYQKFINAANIAKDVDRLVEIRNLIINLPQYHYGTAKYFLNHLKKVSDNYKYTTMDSHNLAVVIAPTLLRRRPDPNEKFANPDDAKNLANQYSLINIIISKSDWIFSSSSEPPPISPKGDKSPMVDKPDLSEIFSSHINSTTHTISDSGSESGSSKHHMKKTTKWLNSKFKRNSRENVSIDSPQVTHHTFTTSSPMREPVTPRLNRTDGLLSSPNKVHKSRQERLEVNSKKVQKSSKKKQSRRSTQVEPVSKEHTVEDKSKIKRRHTVNSEDRRRRKEQYRDEYEY